MTTISRQHEAKHRSRRTRSSRNSQSCWRRSHFLPYSPVAWLQGGPPTAASSHHGNRPANLVATVNTGLVGANGGNATVEQPNQEGRSHQL